MAEYRDKNIQSIDDMKSLISRRGGIARGNRYGVFISHPLKGRGGRANTPFMMNTVKRVQMAC